MGIGEGLLWDLREPVLEIGERCRSWSSGLDAMVPGLSSGGGENSSFIEKRPC